MIEDFDNPELWIVAGPNGSGKSTLYSNLVVESRKETILILNPDKLAKKIALNESLEYGDANREAVVRIEKWLGSCVETYQTIGVETVLSTDKYRKLVVLAKERGFTINLAYVFLSNAELNVERVKIRVSEGGHDVPEEKIKARRDRSFHQLSWFFEKADKAFIFDNSGAVPKQIATKNDTNFTYSGDLKGEIYEAIFANYPDLKATLESKV